MHQTVGNVSFNVPSTKTPQDQIPGTLAATVHRIHSAMHTTARATPVQLVFGWDSILNAQHMTDWKWTQSHEQDMTVENDVKENSECKEHVHELNELTMVKQDCLA